MEKMFLHFWNEPDEVTAFFFFFNCGKRGGNRFHEKKNQICKRISQKNKKKGGGIDLTKVV